jgi:hypothetical protein
MKNMVAGGSSERAVWDYADYGGKGCRVGEAPPRNDVLLEAPLVAYKPHAGGFLLIVPDMPYRRSANG